MTWTRSVSTHQFVKMKYIFLFLITVRREKLWGLTLTFLSWHLHSLCKTFLERSWPTWHCCQDYSTVLGRLQGCLASSSGATKAIFSSKLQGRAELFYGQNTYRCKTELQPRDQRPLHVRDHCCHLPFPIFKQPWQASDWRVRSRQDLVQQAGSRQEGIYSYLPHKSITGNLPLPQRVQAPGFHSN